MDDSLMVIFPYQYEDTWYFDDWDSNLEKEPFIEGIPEIIDHLVKEIPNASEGFKLIFSEKPFPGFQQKLTWLEEEDGGNWYKMHQGTIKGWLCPALFKYWEEAPKEIYVKAEAKMR